MRNITLFHEGSEYKQIQKRTARKLFDQGETVYTIPCKANIYSNWIGLKALNIDQLDETDKKICEKLNIPFFNRMISENMYYNHSELGNYLSFYIKIEK